jgi:hypothetical protein
MADPRIVSNPRTIPALSYRELRELAYMGATYFMKKLFFPSSISTSGECKETQIFLEIPVRSS